MIDKFWNGRNARGLITAMYYVLLSVLNRLQDKFTTLLWRNNLKAVGSNLIVQKKFQVRYPNNIELGDNVIIERNVEFTTELKNSYLVIGSNSEINSNVIIDYSGGVHIGENVVISSKTRIFSHSHGYDPKSQPLPKSLVIGNNVWIGSNVLITENVEYIGNHSLIAAGSVLTKNVNEHSIFGGNPAKFLKSKI